MQLPVREFLQQSISKPVIDVRSPGEYAQGHIPGAVSIPLFTDEERAKVGTKYKQVNKEAALLAGLDIVGPKMSGFVKKSQKIASKGEVLVHCWRGGMRSGSFAWLLQTAGLKVDTLQKGYKAYRTEVLQFFGNPFQLLILGGKTGSGKSELLRELALQGEQVLDLEALAHHKGSSFGAIGELPQPTVEQFENELHKVLSQMNPEKRIWVEDESFTIGTVRIPLAFYQQMRNSPVVFIDVPKELRIKRLVEDYADCHPSLLEAALERIRKRLDGVLYKQALEALAVMDYAKVADLSLYYYDKAYLHGLSKREPLSIHSLAIEGKEVSLDAQRVLDLANELKFSLKDTSTKQPTG
jgi:tRNA 2-selenouridine synthase